MKINFTKIRKKFLSVLITGVFLALLCLPFIQTTSVAQSSINIDYNEDIGFDKGPSYLPVVPLQKTTFVAFDEETYLDDYAYLAAVPSSIFKDEGRLYSNPLLFYQDEYDITEEKELTLNSRQGIDYFMDDWLSYCNGEMDVMTTVNVAEEKVSQWNAKEYNIIESNNPYDIAKNLALSEWAYSDDVVLSVIKQGFEKPDDDIISNKISGSISNIKGVREERFEVGQTNTLEPIFKEFYVPEGYKYIKSETTWDLLSLIGGAVIIPRGDPDTQLYCKYGDEWLETSIGQQYTQLQGPRDYTDSYVYNTGAWKIGITEVPIFSNSESQVDFLGLLKNIFSGEVTYKINIELFEGTELEIPDNPPYECSNAEFKLTWDNPDVNLGFSLIGPAGEEILSATNESDSQILRLQSLGECMQDKHYRVCVFLLNDVDSPVNFEVEYSWSQRIKKEEGNALSSATQGAVLASQLNAPHLYVKENAIPKSTKDALYKLGVKRVHIVDIDGALKKNAKKDISDIADIKSHYKTAESIYDGIRDESGNNDVIFSTIDPWTKWYMKELKPGDETKAGLFIGPAAYIAAHHGSPVLIVDNHPELSSAIVYHNEFWRRYADDRFYHTVSIASMFFTGRQVYDFLERHNFDDKGMETMITVADQYDIGVSWDRVFTGVAKPGRFCSTPVDTSYWISRNMFYPALIYENPALTDELTLVNGSISVRKPLGVLSYPYGNTLKIDRPSQEEKFRYPVLQSYTSGMNHRFNERASKYYGNKYQCADGTIPGETVSFNPIDQGVLLKYEGKEGAYWPDMTASEIIPYYLSEGGYSNVYSTNFTATMDNLNKGSILYFLLGHGTEYNGGTLQFWNPTVKFQRKSIAKYFIPFIGATKEQNPWRGYEWYFGSTQEPDTMTRDLKGAIPLTNIPFPFVKTGLDLVLAKKPFREFLNRLIPLIDPFEVDNLYDGVIMTDYFSQYGAIACNGLKIDNALDNMHSCGFITSACEASNTYLHTSLIRHGSSFQVMDPWATSFYASVWVQSIPRDIVTGDTIGEAFVKGISKVGVLYITDPPQWWWDKLENVCFFGDPDLRPFVPENKHSLKNNWDLKEIQSLSCDSELNIAGHMPFGATDHPHQIDMHTKLDTQSVIIGIMVLVAILVIVVIMIKGRKD